MDTRVPRVLKHVCEVAPGLSAVLIKLRAGHNETGPVPHRERNSALGVMGAPNGNLSSA